MKNLSRDYCADGNANRGQQRAPDSLTSLSLLQPLETVIAPVLLTLWNLKGREGRGGEVRSRAGVEQEAIQTLQQSVHRRRAARNNYQYLDSLLSLSKLQTPGRKTQKQAPSRFVGLPYLTSLTNAFNKRSVMTAEPSQLPHRTAWRVRPPLAQLHRDVE